MNLKNPPPLVVVMFFWLCLKKKSRISFCQKSCLGTVNKYREIKKVYLSYSRKRRKTQSPNKLVRIAKISGKPCLLNFWVALN